MFARTRIRKGGYIGTFQGDSTGRDGPYVLWVTDDDDTQRGIRGRNGLRFLNHSSQPNAEFGGADLYALRNIQPGAEILIHYGDAWKGVP